VNALDIIALVIVVVSGASAATRGLARELISLSATVAGIILAIRNYPLAADFLELFGVSRVAANLIGMVAILASVLLLGALLTLLVRRTVQVLRLSALDHLVGGAFGLVRGYLVVMIVFLALTAFPIREGWLRESQTRSFFLAGSPIVLSLADPAFRERIHEGFQRLWTSDEPVRDAL
jgi:membrane protein required for colicin V production